MTKGEEAEGTHVTAWVIPRLISDYRQDLFLGIVIAYLETLFLI